MYFDDLRLGMTVDISPAVIEKEKMIEFAKAYDNIPLHTDEEYAKATPFGKLIAPGVMSFMSVWANYLEVDFFGKIDQDRMDQARVCRGYSVGKGNDHKTRKKKCQKRSGRGFH